MNKDIIPAFSCAHNYYCRCGIAARLKFLKMKKVFLCSLLLVLFCLGIKAQSPSKHVCLASSPETLLKFGLDYSDNAYHLLLKNIKGSSNVMETNDTYIFETTDGNLFEAKITKDVLDSVSGEGYCSFVVTPQRVSSLSQGIKSVTLVRKGETIPFELYKYTSENFQSATNQVRKDSVHVENVLRREMKKEMRIEIAQKKKEKYQEWLESRTPEYLALVKNSWYVYGGYTNIGWQPDINSGESGMKVGGLRSINLTKRLPIFLEIGAELSYYLYRNSGKIDFMEYKYSNDAIVLTMPISISYKFNINEKLKFIPYVGMNLNLDVYERTRIVNQIDENKFIATLDHFSQEWNTDYQGVNGEIKTMLSQLNFDKSFAPARSNRFLIGLQVGVRFSYKNFVIGADYRRITPNFKRGYGVNVWNATVGYQF